MIISIGCRGGHNIHLGILYLLTGNDIVIYFRSAASRHLRHYCAITALLRNTKIGHNIDMDMLYILTGNDVITTSGRPLADIV